MKSLTLKLNKYHDSMFNEGRLFLIFQQQYKIISTRRIRRGLLIATKMSLELKERMRVKPEVIATTKHYAVLRLMSAGTCLEGCVSFANVRVCGNLITRRVCEHFIFRNRYTF